MSAPSATGPSRWPTRLLRGLGAGAVVLAAGLAASPAQASTSAVSASSAASVAAVTSGVDSRTVSFRVRNVNRSAFPCATDGKTYTVRGHLVGPAGALSGDSAPSATVFLHGLNFGEFLWDYTAVPGYDVASELARRGQTSVVVDRLGYGASDKPDGNQICVGSRADIAHQMVQQLKSGDYTLGGGSPVSFEKVALAGHSYSGQIVELAARSFDDIDAVAVISYTDQGSSALAASSSAYTARVCAAGGMPVQPGGPAHYAPYGDPAGAEAAIFYRPDPAVAADVLGLLTMNPCADMLPFTKAAAANLAALADIEVPVLVVTGGSDALFPTSAGDRQAALLTGSSDVDRLVVPRAGHAITLEPTSDAFVDGIADWEARTLGSTPVGGVDTGSGAAPGSTAVVVGAGLLALLLGLGSAGVALARRGPRG